MAYKETNKIGTVVETLPNQLFKVLIEEKEYICFLSGKMKINNISIFLGDSVEVTIDPYGGKATNRIVRRK